MATIRENQRLQALIFEPLAVDGTNFMEWTNEVRTYLSSEDLDDALYHSTSADLPKSRRQQALMILRRHLDASLRQQYLQNYASGGAMV